VGAALRDDVEPPEVVARTGFFGASERVVNALSELVLR
jgi:hypothetical protein